MTDNKTLREELLAVQEPLFAVLDGAQFDDLPAELFDGDFVHKPLYRNDSVGSQDQLRTAPQLVWLDRQRISTIWPRDTKSTSEENLRGSRCDAVILEKLLTMIGDRHAAVFWVCPAGGDALYRHLRTINMVSIPAGTDVDENDLAVPDEQENSPDALDGNQDNFAEKDLHKNPSDEELVIFRHSDSNVMAQFLPVLDGPQLARLFGPATQIIFQSDEEWSKENGPGVVHRGENISPPLPGPLKLDPVLLQKMGDQRATISRENIIAYLREAAPEYAEKQSDSDLRQLVENAERTGDEIGFESEYGHGLWALLLLMTGQSLINSPEVRNHFASSERTPDELVEELVEELIEADDETWDGWVA